MVWTRMVPNGNMNPAKLMEHCLSKHSGNTLDAIAIFLGKEDSFLAC